MECCLHPNSVVTKTFSLALTVLIARTYLKGFDVVFKRKRLLSTFLGLCLQWEYLLLTTPNVWIQTSTIIKKTK